MDSIFDENMRDAREERKHTSDSERLLPSETIHAIDPQIYTVGVWRKRGA